MLKVAVTRHINPLRILKGKAPKKTVAKKTHLIHPDELFEGQPVWTF